jgi:Molecular chaperone GrpE (heat shock protein)
MTENEQTETVKTEDVDYKSKYLYLLAEVDNYRKTREKEETQFIKSSNEKLMRDMLKVLDDFENVMKHNDNEAIKSLFNSLYSSLSANGLTRMKVLGVDYSSEIAEVVSTEQTEKEKGKILEEVQAGYKLFDKVIRYPKVKIGI